MSDPYQQDIDSFHEFLKSIHSIDEFFDRKKPAFRDWFEREMINEIIDQGFSSAEDMLRALKMGEKQRFVRLRGCIAELEDHWPPLRN